MVAQGCHGDPFKKKNIKSKNQFKVHGQHTQVLNVQASLQKCYTNQDTLVYFPYTKD